jgi:hypothetical protein
MNPFRTTSIYRSRTSCHGLCTLNPLLITVLYYKHVSIAACIQLLSTLVHGSNSFFFLLLLNHHKSAPHMFRFRNEFWNSASFKLLVGSPRRGISPSSDPYKYRTETHKQKVMLITNLLFSFHCILHILYDINRTENTSSKNSSIVVCVFVAAGMYLRAVAYIDPQRAPF